MPQITTETIIVGLFLMVFGLFLKKWKPPIKKQYVFIMLSIVGCILGYFLLDKYGVLYGYIFTGLIFYKNELIEEIKSLIKEIKSLKDTTSKTSKDK